MARSGLLAAVVVGVVAGGCQREGFGRAFPRPESRTILSDPESVVGLYWCQNIHDPVQKAELGRVIGLLEDANINWGGDINLGGASITVHRKDVARARQLLDLERIRTLGE